MVTRRQFFNHSHSSNEQKVLEDLINEAIEIRGEDVYYIPRRKDSYDDIFGEDDTSYFDTPYLIDMYVKTVDGFEGDGSMYSKFGIDTRDQITLTVAKRKFGRDILQYETEMVRPNEGDLIYFEVNKRVFEIRYVDHKPMFYQLGANYTYDLYCEVWEYSGEEMRTGIEEIDSLQTNLSVDVYDFALLDEDGTVLTDETGNILTLEAYEPIGFGMDPIFNNDDFQLGAADFLDFTEHDPFSGGTY